MKSSLGILKKFFICLSICICFLSCTKNTINHELLLGEWEFVKYRGNSDSSVVYFRSDFRFEKDSIFKLNDGFFQRGEKPNEYKYLGQKSKFYVDRDSLYIFNTITKNYFSQKISHLYKDTLALYDDQEKITFYYTKRRPKTATKINLSQITLSLGPCFGTCPISSISIDNEGNIIYLGESNTENIGFYKGRIDKKIFHEIESDLNKIRFIELKNEYSVEATDLPDLSVTFINDEKIIKTIYAYGNTEPRNLKPILNKIIYSYQNANLKKFEFNYPILNQAFPPQFLINNSEAFYLQTLLLKAKKTEFQFKPKYYQTASLILPESYDYENYEQMKRKIETDGRYFKLENKNHQFSTFDIGFDFFKVNESFSVN